MQQKWTPRSGRYTTTVHAGSQKRKQKPTPFSGWHPLPSALGPPCRARLPMGQRNLLLLLLLRPSHSLLRPVFLPAPVSPSPPPDCCPLQQFSPGRPVLGPLLPCHLHRSFDRQRRSRCIVHQGESLADHEGGVVAKKAVGRLFVLVVVAAKVGFYGKRGRQKGGGGG